MTKEIISYRLTMTSEQAHAARKAIELLMRLKLGQYNELPFALIDLSREDFAERRDAANERLRVAFAAMQDYKKDGEYKDREWYVLYNMLQVIRHAIHDVEYPDGKGVDGYEPMAMGGKPLPKIEIVRSSPKE